MPTGEPSEATQRMQATQQPGTGLLSGGEQYYCRYCAEMVTGVTAWEVHCASETHVFHIHSDKEHQWNFRQPRWHLTPDQYQLCTAHANHASCKFSFVPDQFNECEYAHSTDELDEWSERYAWREMKRAYAAREGLVRGGPASYMDRLLDEYERAGNRKVHVLTEQLPSNISITCTSELAIHREEKQTQHCWDFHVYHSTPFLLSFSFAFAFPHLPFISPALF